MNKFILASVFISLISFAHADDRMTAKGPHNVAMTLGFNRGGFTLGGEYEYMTDSSFGIGGFIREFPKDTGIRHTSDGYMIFGATADHHFYKKNWDLSFAPGFAVININSATLGKEDTTTLGPVLAINLLWQLTPNVALGIENSRYWVWFSSDWAGELRDDLSLKARFSF